jgi:hypothetical protein
VTDDLALPPSEDELLEFEELARLCRPGTNVPAEWGEDLAAAVARLVAEVRRLRSAGHATPQANSDGEESRRIHEEATRLLVAASASKPVIGPTSPYMDRTAADQAWQRGIARAAAWLVIVLIVLGFVIAFPSLLAVLLVAGLLWWAIRVLIRTSKPRQDGKV